MSQPLVGAGQAPRAVVMVRPHSFAPNQATAGDNAFQSIDSKRAPDAIAAAAYAEATQVAKRIEQAGVTVHLFEDVGTATPDSLFPNNWFSTHAGGHIAIFPMYAPNRRQERRADVIEMLKRRYRVQDVVDYSGLEMDGIFLEGTGAMVFDHIERVAYAVRSNRASAIMLERFCTQFNFEPMIFDAIDGQRRPIYHTNVMMGLGTQFAMIGLDAIVDPARRDEIRIRLEDTGRHIVDLSQNQIMGFAGNVIELLGKGGPVLALSARALAVLRQDQIAVLERFVTLLPLDVPTIELAGGSVRCMIAGIHLAARDVPRVA